MPRDPHIGYGLIKHDAVVDGIAPDIEHLFPDYHGLRVVATNEVDLTAPDIANLYQPDIDAGIDTCDPRARELGAFAMLGSNMVIAVELPVAESPEDALVYIRKLRGKSYDTPAARTVRGMFPSRRPANFEDLTREEQLPYLVQNRFHAPDTTGGSQVLKNMLGW